MMDGGMGNMIFSGGFFMILFGIFVIILIVWLVRFLAANDGGNNHSKVQQQTPAEILEARYAQGEIDDEEFNHRKEMLDQ